MANKKEVKVVLERIYNVPLRKEFQKAPKWRRTKKAVSALRAFIAKHMKSNNVKIGKYLNLELWKRGVKNPPSYVKVKCKKDSKGDVTAEIVGAPEPELKKAKEKVKEEVKEVKKKEKPKTKEEKIEKKVEEIKEKKKEEAREIEKEELKEIKKEHPKTHVPKEQIKEKRVETHPTAPMQRG